MARGGRPDPGASRERPCDIGRCHTAQSAGGVKGAHVERAVRVLLLRLEVTALASLICGSPTGTGALADTLQHLATALEDLRLRLPRPYGEQDEDADPLAIPFAARALLELSCTAMIARADPFRVLVVRMAQQQGSYDPAQRHAAAIQWQGDVLSSGKTAPLWDPTRAPSSMSRALLGDYMQETLWRPAYVRCIDAISMASPRISGERVRELLAKDERAFIPWIRGQAQAAYSEASKGIHHEFLTSSTARHYDSATLEQLVGKIITVCSVLGCVINFCEHVPFRPDEGATLAAFRRFA